jgi:hypothetical protein
VTQTQLLAIDTILPTVLGIVGLVFLATGIWSMGGPRGYGLRAATFSLVGVAAIAVGVWLWINLVSAAGRVGGVAAPATVSAAPSGAASPASAAIISAAPTAASSASQAPPASSSASAAAAATATPVPTSTPVLSLTPVPPLPFQPENTNPHTVIVGVQAFEHGSMLYRDDLKQIYVLTPDKKFTVYKDTWVEGQNPDLAGAAPEGKLRPGRGFGWLWYSDPDVRNMLGFAITAEQGFTGSISGDGTTTTIRADVTYAFNKDGTWALK